VGVVLEGEADPAEDLDAVLGDLDRAVEGDRGGHVGGEVALLGIGRDGGGRVPGSSCDRLGGLQHLRTQVLDRLEAADALPELLAHLRVVHRRRQAPPSDARGLGGSQRDGGTPDCRGRHARQVRPGRRVAHRHRAEAPREVHPRDRLARHGLDGQQQPANLGFGEHMGRGRGIPQHPVERQPHKRVVRHGMAGSAQHGRRHRRTQQRTGHELVGTDLQRDGLVEQAATTPAEPLGHGDRGHAHLGNCRPDRGEARARVALGGPDRLAAVQVGGPGAQARGQLDVVGGDPDRHVAPDPWGRAAGRRTRTCSNPTRVDP